jgi:predicted O-methyltransferase YrrM
MNKITKIIFKVISRIISEILPSTIMKHKSNFHLWQSKGYHVTPVHYYQNIPDTRNFPSDFLEKQSNLTGIEMHEKEQISLLSDFSAKYRGEYSEFGFESDRDNKDFYFGNGAFETVDAEILYCMVRSNKPGRIIEIGSGYSTLVTAKAIRKNIEEDPAYICELTCIEPYPKEWLRNIPELTKIIQSFVEKLPLETFNILKENDIIFIDSSHAINAFNDVCFEYLDLIPNLNKGVIIHIHDILLPNHYSQDWLDMKVFWTEQYLLQAFLAFNTSYKVLWAGNFMHLKHPRNLAESLPSYTLFKNNIDITKRTQGHKSFWIQKID